MATSLRKRARSLGLCPVTNLTATGVLPCQMPLYTCTTEFPQECSHSNPSGAATVTPYALVTWDPCLVDSHLGPLREFTSSMRPVLELSACC